jgi:hypothetical protein
MDSKGKRHIQHHVPMKKTTLILLCVTSGLGTANADETVKNAMKKNFKPEDALAKKAGKGEASDAELAGLLKCFEALAKAKPAKGSDSSWAAKTGALVAAVKKVQAKDPSGFSDLKKATNCKACHDVHKGK